MAADGPVASEFNRGPLGLLFSKTHAGETPAVTTETDVVWLMVVTHLNLSSGQAGMLIRNCRVDSLPRAP